jgi:hypothetical protein
MRLLVTGGTGMFGSHALPVLLARGHGLRVLSRSERPNLPAGATAVRGDLASGTGVEDALADVDMVLHAASDTRRMGRTDEAQTRRLLAAAERPVSAGCCTCRSSASTRSPSAITAISLCARRSSLPVRYHTSPCGLPSITICSVQCCVGRNSGRSCPFPSIGDCSQSRRRTSPDTRSTCCWRRTTRRSATRSEDLRCIRCAGWLTRGGRSEAARERSHYHCQAGAPDWCARESSPCPTAPWAARPGASMLPRSPGDLDHSDPELNPHDQGGTA